MERESAEMGSPLKKGAKAAPPHQANLKRLQPLEAQSCHPG